MIFVGIHITGAWPCLITPSLRFVAKEIALLARPYPHFFPRKIYRTWYEPRAEDIQTAAGTTSTTKFGACVHASLLLPVSRTPSTAWYDTRYNTPAMRHQVRTSVGCEWYHRYQRLKRAQHQTPTRMNTHLKQKKKNKLVTS